MQPLQPVSTGTGGEEKTMTQERKWIAALLALILSLSLAMGLPGLAAAEETSTEVNRFNVVLVIDKSGSLKTKEGGTDPDGLRFDAMRLFLGLLTERGNNVGAVVFDEKIRYEAEPQPMNSMEEKKALIRELEAFSPSYDTDIGGAVLRATEMLTGMYEENGLPCMILLLTDGKTDFTRGDAIERKRESWKTAEEALKRAREEGITISGILLNVDRKDGNGRAEFEKYTQGTHGVFDEVSRPEDLAAAFRGFYSIINNTVYTGAQRVAFSDQGKAEFFFTVPSFGVEEVNVVVEHETAPGDDMLNALVGLEITAPDGSVYDYTGHELVSSRYILVKIPNPAVGEWRVNLTGEPEDWVDVTMVYNASMTISIDGEKESGVYRAYSPYVFTAAITDPGVEHVTREDLESMNAVLSVENLATGDVREYAMTPADGAYTCEISFLRGGDYSVSAQAGLGGFKVRSGNLELSVEPWPLVAKINNITDILQFGSFVGDCWELEIGELFGVADASGIRYTLSEDYDGRLTLEDGKLRARFGDLDAASFVLTASDLMGQSANVYFDVKVPHVTAADSVTNMLSVGSFGDHSWNVELGELFRDPKDTPLRYELSDDYGGQIRISDTALEMDLHELREAQFSLSATDIFGVRAELPFDLKVPGPQALRGEISETIKTGPFQEGTLEIDLNSIFREPKGTALRYTLSDDFGGKAVIENNTLKVDCKGLKKAEFTVKATDEYDLSTELPLVLTEKNMLGVYALYALAPILGGAGAITLISHLRKKNQS